MNCEDTDLVIRGIDMLPRVQIRHEIAQYGVIALKLIVESRLGCGLHD